MGLVLTEENYYSETANKDYMSVSQFKDFVGSTTHGSCENTAMKKAAGIIKQPKTTPLLVGSYVDSYFEGTLEQFREENPEIYKKTGDKGLKAEFTQAEDIISRIESDDLFAAFMSGQKQVIMTATLFGVEWKIKMDSYHPDEKIVDLKIMKDMKPIWSDSLRTKVDFIRHWGYDIQGAIYQKVVEIVTGKKLPFYLACATKETPTDIEIIEITQPYLDRALEFVEENIEHVVNVKTGVIAPTACHTCFYCKIAKKLTNPITIDSIIPVYSQPDDADNDAVGFSLFD